MRPRFAGAQLVAAALAMTAATAAARPILVGFYLPWDATSQASLLQHAGALDVIAPMAGALESAAGSIRWQDDPARAALLARGHATPKVLAVVSNAHDNVWDTAAADGALLNPQAGAAFIGNLLAQAKARDYGGYILDFESLSPQGAAAYEPFLARVRAALKPQGLELWVTAGLATEPTVARRLSEATDTVVLMAYDQCWANSTPGPIAGQAWLQAALDARLAGADPNRFVVALGAYGYDWLQGRPATVISAPDAARLARKTGQSPTHGPPAANPHFSYVDAGGQPHAVWYLDARAFRAQRAAAEARGIRGVAIWRLGLEDPAIWTRGGAAAAGSLGGSARPPPAACVTLPKLP